MAIDLQTIKDLVASYKEEYLEQHRKFTDLRDLYHGRFGQFAERQAQDRSITSIFRDLGRANTTRLPPIRIQRNTIQAVCVKYQSFLSPVPMVNYYVDAPETDERRHEMTTKERYTYGVWRAGQMSKVLNQVAWYHPLMGDVFIGCFPDTKQQIPVPVIRSPEHAYPIRGFGSAEPTAHIFHWKERDSVLRASFPAYAEATRNPQPGRGFFGRTTEGRGSDPLVDVYEYSDANEFARYCGTTRVNGIEHGFGFDIFQHSKFIDVPGETFGHSAVEQAVNLNEADNLIQSLLFQAVLENVFPTIVLTDPTKAPEEMMKGPGSVITLNPGGKFEQAMPPLGALGQQLNYLAGIKDSIQEQTGMPAVNFGVSPASSIVTGAAINELQGAGTGSTVQMVQAGLGLVMSRWNEMAIYQQRKMWPDKTITLNYMSPLTRAGGSTAQGTMEIKGSELKGGTANEIIFSPAMDQHDKLVMWLQAKGAGLVSDQFILKNVGIPDPDAMQEEIFQEQMDKAVLGFLLQQFQQAPDPAAAPQAEMTALSFLEGRPVHVPGVTRPGVAANEPAPQSALPGGTPGVPSPGGPPGASASPPPGGTAPSPGGGNITQNIGPAGGGGLVKSPPLNLPPGAPVPAGSGAADAMAQQASAQPQTLTADALVAKLSSGTYKGRVWLVGEVAATGKTTGVVDVAVTDPADRETVQGLMPQVQFRFHVVKGQPQEQSLEITGGGPQE